MQKKYLNLYKKFDEIRQIKWIKSMRKGPTGVGYTFETLLGKNEDNKQLPDYDEIEIKTMKYFSKKKIHLFNCSPESEDEQMIQKIIEKLGYPDKEYPEYKVFNISINAKNSTYLGYKKLQLIINYKEEKIVLEAKTIFGKKINIDLFWSFKTIENIIMNKMKKLAIIKACSKKINNEEYYYYTRIEFYEIKKFEEFIKLIEKGIITITFKIGIWKVEEKFGKIHDRGTDFSIQEKDIELLYNKKDFYE